MTSPVSCSCDIVQCFNSLGFDKDVRYFLRPKENKDKLKVDLENLLNRKDVIEAKVNNYVDLHPKYKSNEEVDRWFREVINIKKEVQILVDSYQPCWYCKSNRKFGKRTSELMKEVERLYCKGENWESESSSTLVHLSPPQCIEYVPRSTSKSLGIDAKISKILTHLDNKDVYIIGIHGAGGVGKTTLLLELNNDILKKDSIGFDYVIWLTISRDVDIEKIQNQIVKRMGYQLPVDPEERSDYIFQCLSTKKKFLFLMDDMWSKVDLKKIGIPIHHDNKNCKIVFTTRFDQVCRDMDANETEKMEYLDWQNSWELFCKNLDGKVDLNDQHIVTCAKAFARKCGGLPLALKVVAKAVRFYTTIPEWQDAWSILERSPSAIDGVEENLFNILRISIDNLKDEQQKKCILYCSLIPKNLNFGVDYLTELWVAEGLIYNDNNDHTKFECYHKKGLKVISSLQSACLLEKSPLGDDVVDMHDVVHDMCLYITNHKHNEENMLEVWDSRTLNDNDDVEVAMKRWERATKVSCIGSNIQHLGSQIGRCPKLVTLLLHKCEMLREIHHDLFQFMPNLRVLDLSETRISEVPNSIKFLVHLQYLGLYGTKIKALPKEVGELVCLRQLEMYDTEELVFIPKEALSRLGALEKLDICPSNYEWGNVVDEDEEDLSGCMFRLDDFTDLKKLVELHIDICSRVAFKHLTSTLFFHKLIKQINLSGPDFQARDVTDATRTFSYLISVRIQSCPRLYDIVFSGHYLVHLVWLELIENANLRNITFKGEEETREIVSALPQFQQLYIPFGAFDNLFICRCPLKDLSFIGHLPSLTDLQVESCNELQNIVSVNNEEPALRKLQYLNLRDLPNLTTISGTNSSLPSLRTLEVVKCPELRRLPFEADNCSIQQILGTKQWWDNLQWESNTLCTYLRGYFKPQYYE